MLKELYTDSHMLYGPSCPVFCIAKYLDNHIVSCSSDSTLHFWNLTKISVEYEQVWRDVVIGEFVVITSDYHIVNSSANGNYSIRIYYPNITYLDVDILLEGHSDEITVVVELLNGNLISASLDMTMRIWDIDTGNCLHVLRDLDGFVQSLAVLTNNYIACGMNNGNINIWNLESLECEKVLRGHVLCVYCLLVLPDGRLVSGGGDSLIRIWNINTSEYTHVLCGHESRITSLALLRGGYLVSSSYDKSIRIWNISTGECIKRKRITSRIHCVLTMSDGQIVAGCDDGVCIFE